ncbi:RluA family pseudouridine synthase [Rubrivirga sp. IMCC45206]|uniref:RluA family pseudouridine synthase n=1 Tax=Rubrivirga sp. IMCC45206 TaxID=3391614 RepID=UPI0039902ACB
MSTEPDKIEVVLTLDVPPGQSPIRVDLYLTEKTANATRSKVQRAIKEGRVDLNGKTITKVSTQLQPGDTVVCRVMRPPPIEIEPEDIPLDVVYEDDTLLVVVKPAGMVVHPAYGHRSGTLINALLQHVGAGPLAGDEIEDADDDDIGLAVAAAGPRYEGDPTVRPGLVHRLDKDTTGLMVVAKTDVAAAHLGDQFANRTISRQYLALVWGDVEEAGRVEGWLGRSPRDRKKISVRPEGEGKWAATTYEPVERFGFTSLVRFQLETGRTHQIRVHAKSVGHPVFGDTTYGGDSIVYGSAEGSRKAFMRNLFNALGPRQALHAATLGFVHPTTGEHLSFEAPLPDDMQHVVDRLRRVEGAGQA